MHSNGNGALSFTVREVVFPIERSRVRFLLRCMIHAMCTVTDRFPRSGMVQYADGATKSAAKAAATCRPELALWCAGRLVGALRQPLRQARWHARRQACWHARKLVGTLVSLLVRCHPRGLVRCHPRKDLRRCTRRHPRRYTRMNTRSQLQVNLCDTVAFRNAIDVKGEASPEGTPLNIPAHTYIFPWPCRSNTHCFDVVAQNS